MGLLSSTYNKLERFILNRTSDNKILIEASARRGSPSISTQIQKPARNPSEQTLQKWKNAVAMATDQQQSDRSALSQLYDNLMIDNHLCSVIDSRILYAQRSAFKLVNEKGDENKDISWLFERPWFDDLIRMVLFSRYQGCTLIELYQINAAGELAEVTEIPQSHFNAHKGVILKEQGALTGWQYREEPFLRHYVQVGKSDDLGMLEKLAPIVLAKKMGLGSWLDYIDKYGVPPLFITTDREEPERLNELHRAAENFRSNSFVIGKGNEKFEIGSVTGTAGADNFDKLIARADKEISKRVLGGSGITDEKSFVGSVDIQYKLAKDRYESDKLFVEYLINTEIIPRLMRLSPVYACLKNHYFDWDDNESLSQGELIDAMVKLGSQYYVCPKYISDSTGIPILGQKSAPLGNSPEVETGKK